MAGANEHSALFGDPCFNLNFDLKFGNNSFLFKTDNREELTFPF